MKKVACILIWMISPLAWSGCLDNLTTAQTISSKVKGIYINSPSWRGNHYVILDRESCSASGSSEQLASGTKGDYYLMFEDGDKLLQSSLLMAYAKGEIVKFRIGATVNNYNKINYIIVPFDAR